MKDDEALSTIIVLIVFLLVVAVVLGLMVEASRL